MLQQAPSRNIGIRIPNLCQKSTTVHSSMIIRRAASLLRCVKRLRNLLMNPAQWSTENGNRPRKSLFHFGRLQPKLVEGNLAMKTMGLSLLHRSYNTIPHPKVRLQVTRLARLTPPKLLRSSLLCLKGPTNRHIRPQIRFLIMEMTEIRALYLGSRD